MIKRTICIKNHQDRGMTGNTYTIVDGVLVLNTNGIPYNSISGVTTGNTTEYYTGQTSSEAYIGVIPIMLTQTIDDIGYYDSGLEEWIANTSYNVGNVVEFDDNSKKCISAHTSSEVFNESFWITTPTGSSEYDITFTGETKINQFRRYGKTDSDFDLYNPIWNTGFTQVINTSNGLSKQIIGERNNLEELTMQKLYEYKIWVSTDTGTTLNYYDINSNESVITYKSSGLTNNNSIEGSNVKVDHLIGLVETPKINVDVFIDRGNNSSFERHLRLGDIKSLSDMENYGNGYYKIKED